jgi:hypothetical protein
MEVAKVGARVGNTGAALAINVGLAEVGSEDGELVGDLDLVGP